MKLMLIMLVSLSLFSCREKAAEKVSVYQKNKVPEYPEAKPEEVSQVELLEGEELTWTYTLYEIK